MTVKLTAEDLRGLADYLEALNSVTRKTSVQGCAYGNGAVQMEHWSHALSISLDSVKRWPDDEDGAWTYTLVVGSDS